MKKLILISIILSFTILAQNGKRTLTIDKNTQGGFNIYNSQGDLLYEYIKRNTDSLSLETLDEIFFEASMINLLKDTLNKPLEVNVQNWPENDTFFWQFLKVFLPTLAGIIFGWLLGFLPQRNQSIQNTFFQLLQNQNKILESISVDFRKTGVKEQLNGTQFFNHIKNKMFELNEFIRSDYPNSNNISIRDAIRWLEDNVLTMDKLIAFHNSRPEKKATDSEINYERKLTLHLFNFIFHVYEQNLSNYFRHLFNIILYVDNSRFLFNKKKLINFLKAKMSDAELFILFYDGLKFAKMESYIEKYNLIRNLHKRDLLNESHEKFYVVRLLQS